MNRILPNLKKTQDYDKVLHAKLIKEKQDRENLATLIQFQNKVNSDLSHKSREGVKATEFEKEKCDEEDLKYRHTKSVAPNKEVFEHPDTGKQSLLSFNQGLFNELKQQHSQNLNNFANSANSQEVNNLTSSNIIINILKNITIILLNLNLFK